MTSPSQSTTPATSGTPLTPETSSVRGRFLWYELMTPDPAAAGAFYAKIMGWQTAEWTYEGATEPYTLFNNGEIPVAGMMRLPDQASAAGAPPHWIAYVGTPDLDATYAEALALGARSYVAPMEVPTVGRMAVLADPQGATFALYTPASPLPDAAQPGDGEFSWHELATTDHRAAFAFYAQLTGWQSQVEMDMGPLGIYHIFGRGAQQLGGIYDKPADMPAPPHWLLYVRVPDLGAALERVKAEGGQVLNGPTEVPGGDFVAQCMDPQGGAFALHGKGA